MAIFGKKYDISMLQTTSKDALKKSALQMCDGDVKSAMEIYEFFVKDMPEIPDFDRVPPTFFEQAKDTIGGVLGWVDQNQDKILNYYQLFKSLRGSGGAPSAPTNLPQI